MKAVVAKLSEEHAGIRNEDKERHKKDLEGLLGTIMVVLMLCADLEAKYIKELEVSRLSQSEQVQILRQEIEDLTNQHAQQLESLRQLHSQGTL